MCIETQQMKIQVEAAFTDEMSFAILHSEP